MAKRMQFCTGCGWPIRHGFPRGRALFCGGCISNPSPRFNRLARTGSDR